MLATADALKRHEPVNACNLVLYLSLGTAQVTSLTGLKMSINVFLDNKVVFSSLQNS